MGNFVNNYIEVRNSFLHKARDLEIITGKFVYDIFFLTLQRDLTYKAGKSLQHLKEDYHFKYIKAFHEILRTGPRNQLKHGKRTYRCSSKLQKYK